VNKTAASASQLANLFCFQAYMLFMYNCSSQLREHK